MAFLDRGSLDSSGVLHYASPVRVGLSVNKELFDQLAKYLQSGIRTLAADMPENGEGYTKSINQMVSAESMTASAGARLGHDELDDSALLFAVRAALQLDRKCFRPVLSAAAASVQSGEFPVMAAGTKLHVQPRSLPGWTVPLAAADFDEGLSAAWKSDGANFNCGRAPCRPRRSSGA